MSAVTGDTTEVLSGKIAVITGGSGYLCSEMGCALSKQGAKVIVLSRNQDTLDSAVKRISAAGSKAEGISVDVCNSHALTQACESITEEWGACDILINGAGGNNKHLITTEEFCDKSTLDAPDTLSFFDMLLDDVEDNIRLNFTSAFHACQLFARKMVEKGSGNIINISSMSVMSAITRVPVYGASKAALDNFTRWLAVHLSKVGIRVNAIAPGFFLGEQNRRLLVAEDGSYTERGKKIIANTPAGCFGNADELTSTLLYLVSDGSAFVTGQVICVDGGFSIFSGV